MMDESKLEPPDIHPEDGPGRSAENPIEIFEQLMDLPAEGRNFQIESVDNDKGELESIVLIGDNGQKVDLRKYLPEGFRFVESDIYYSDQDRKIVGVPVEKTPSRSFLLGLFHEIGHIQDRARHFQFTKERLDELKLQALAGTQPPGIDSDKQIAGIDNLLKMLEGEDYDQSLPVWMGDDKHDLFAIAERNANAAALRIMRSLHGDGYNVFAGFSSVQDIRNTISAVLYSYELKRLEETAQRATQGENVENYNLKYVRPHDVGEIERDR